MSEQPKFIIKHSNGSYYIGWTAIGPQFGSSKKDALRFESKNDAISESGKHFGFVQTEIEEIKE